MTDPRVPSEAGGPDRVAQELWDALNLARRQRAAPAAVARLEDEVFWFYQPLARSVAAVHTGGVTDPEKAVQMAEIALAQAVLRWQRSDSQGFPRFARDRINAQLGRDRSRRERARHHPKGLAPDTNDP